MVSCSNNDFYLSAFMITPNDLACYTFELEFVKDIHYRNVTIINIEIALHSMQGPYTSGHLKLKLFKTFQSYFKKKFKTVLAKFVCTNSKLS